MGRDRQGFSWANTTKYRLIKRYVRCLSSKEACQTSGGYFYTNLSDTVKLPSLLRMLIDQGLQLPAYCSSVLGAKKPSIYSADKWDDKVISVNDSSHDTFLRPWKRAARGRYAIRNKAFSARKTGVTVCRISSPATLADSLIPRHGDSGWVGKRDRKQPNYCVSGPTSR